MISVQQVRADMIPMRWCRPGPHSSIKISSKLSLHNVHDHESDVSKTSSSSQFPSHDSQVIPATSPTHLRQQQFGRYTSFRGCCKSLKTLPSRNTSLWLRCMLFTTTNVRILALDPDPAPAFRNGQTLWKYLLQKAQWASNASNDTDLCYPDTASLEKRIEKVSSDAMSIDRLHRPRSLRPPVRPKFLWEQISLSMQACNSQPSSKAKKPETELLGRQFSVKVNSQQPKCSESSSRSLSPCPLSYSNPCITSVYASHLFNRCPKLRKFVEKIQTMVNERSIDVEKKRKWRKTKDFYSLVAGGDT